MENTSWYIRLAIAFDRLLAILAGADPDKITEPDDRNIIRSLASLLLLVWVFQTTMWTAAAHRVLASPGEFHVGYLAFAALLATIVLLLESLVVLRSSHHLHGQQEIKRGGFDISGGFLARAKHSAFLAVRIAVAVGFAQLTALLLGLIVFGSDIARESERTFQQENAALFTAARARVDRDIAAAAAAHEDVTAQIGVVTRAIAEAREAVVRPAANDPRLRTALERVANLEAVKARADQALADAQSFAADELAGIKRRPGNSGKPGAGPVRAAAEEQVANTEARVAAAQAEVAAARRDLAGIQATVDETASQERAQAKERLAELNAELQAMRAREKELSAEYRARVDNREPTIRDVVLRDPTHVPLAKGFLADIQALHRIAKDPASWAVIILVEAVGFAVECAAILGKIAGYAPTYFERRLAREHFLDAVEGAEEIVRRLRESERNVPHGNGSHSTLIDFDPAPHAPGNGSGQEPAKPEEASPPEPPKRKRGRPPKAKPPMPLPPPDSGEPGGESEAQSDQPGEAKK